MKIHQFSPLNIKRVSSSSSNSSTHWNSSQLFNQLVICVNLWGACLVSFIAVVCAKLVQAYKTANMAEAKKVIYLIFTLRWRMMMLFVYSNSTPICLICNVSVTSPKKGNLEQHFKMLHKLVMCHAQKSWL